MTESPKGWDEFNIFDVNTLHVVSGEWDERLVDPENIYRLQEKLKIGYVAAFELASRIEEAEESRLLYQALYE